jgi:hypothetical protein
MHYIPPLTEYCDGDLFEPVGYWTWSLTDRAHLHQKRTIGDTFIRDNEIESYDACLDDMLGEAGADSVLYIRDTDGSLRGAKVVRPHL